MTPVLNLTIAFAAGGALGVLYFLSLWRSTLGILDGGRSWALVWVALVARIACAAAVLYATARIGGWQALAAATAGFTLARYGVARRRSFGEDRRNGVS